MRLVWLRWRGAFWISERFYFPGKWVGCFILRVMVMVMDWMSYDLDTLDDLDTGFILVVSG